MAMQFSMKPLVVAALLAAAGSAHSAINVFTSEASFLAAVVDAATDTFNDLTPATPYTGPLNRAAGDYTYTVSTTPNSNTLYGAGTTGDAWLSSDAAADFILFDNFSPGVTAIGAYVFGSDIGGNFLQKGVIAVRVSNGVDTDVEFEIKAGTTNYFGFTSDAPILSFEVKSLYLRNTPVWPTVNDLTMAAAVPEPETYALMLAGLAAIGFMARRRRG